MPRLTKEPQEEEEIPPFLEALAISWGHPIPNSNYDSSANSSRKHEQTRHESPVTKTNSRMSDYEEQDSPIMNRYASTSLTPDTSHTIEPSEASSHIRSTPTSSYHTTLEQSHELSRSTDLIQTLSTHRDSSYHTARGSSVYNTSLSRLQSGASQSQLTTAEIHQKESKEDPPLSIAS